MRFSEFQSTVESVDQDIIAAALIARDKAEADGSNKMPMTLFINMLKNSETPLSYNTLVSAYESNPKLKNIIQQFNKDEVVFVDTNPADGTDSIEQPVGDVPPEKKVQQMAAKAAAKREDIGEADKADSLYTGGPSSDDYKARSKPWEEKVRADMAAGKDASWFLDRKQGAGQKWTIGTDTWFAVEKYQKERNKPLSRFKRLAGLGEVAPPGREKQVKKLKKKFDDPGIAYAIAWSQHNKSGKPKKKS